MPVLKIKNEQGQWEAIAGGGSNVEVDKTLSVDGMAADAKIVGDAINDLSIDISEAGSIDIDLDGSNLGEANGINADTLGRIHATDYATISHVNQEVRKAAPNNILDNSNFTNPVNQRGQNSYTSSDADWCYGIDRWFGAGDAVVTVENGYVNFKSAYGEETVWIQGIESNKIKNGKKYTLVCELLDGSIFSKIITASIDSTDGVNIEQNSTIFLSNDSNLNTIYFVGFWTKSTDGVNIKNVALYEGEYTADTLPEYQPKGYGAELVECLRYLQLHFVNLKYSNYYQYLPITVPMRATPSAIVVWKNSDIMPDIFCDNNICVYAQLPEGSQEGSWIDAAIGLSAEL